MIDLKQKYDAFTVAVMRQALNEIVADRRFLARTSGTPLERFPAGLNPLLPVGGSLTGANQIRSSLPTAAGGDHGKGLFDGLESSCSGLGRGR